jgi:hypothetical protein
MLGPMDHGTHCSSPLHPPHPSPYTQPGHALARINFVDHDEDGLVGEQWLYAVEQRCLRGDAVSAPLADVHQVQAGGAQVREGGDGLWCSVEYHDPGCGAVGWGGWRR